MTDAALALKTAMDFLSPAQYEALSHAATLSADFDQFFMWAQVPGLREIHARVLWAAFNALDD